MAYFSKAPHSSPVKVRRIRPIAVPIVATVVAASSVAHAQDVTLRMSREIEPPYRRGAQATGAPDAAARVGDSIPPLAPSVASSLKPPPAPEERGAVFLRADRLEGRGDKTVEASGKVELRTRRETVLADFLTYDIEKLK